jgi:hypothetical protein
MGFARHCDLAAVRRYCLTNLVAIRRYDDAVRDINVDHALPDADDERNAGQKAERLPGEARRAQSGWDDSERVHASRSVGVELSAAKFTS